MERTTFKLPSLTFNDYIFTNRPLKHFRLILFDFQMTEQRKQSYQKIAKILSILRKRRKTSNPSTKSSWPTSSSFTLINNIETVTHDPQPTQKQYFKSIHTVSARTLKSATMSTTSPILRLTRPTTSCTVSLKKHRKTQPVNKICQEKSLFQCIRDEKLNKLQEQKEELLTNIFNSDKIEIHRIDEDENICVKTNAINFRTYFSLNKLMNLQEKINETTNMRPQTSCSYMKRRNKEKI